jgi:hypothetical protein
MIYETLYRDAGEAYMAEFRSRFEKYTPVRKKVQELGELLDRIDEVAQQVEALEYYKPHVFEFDIKQALHGYFEKAIIVYDRKVATIKAEALAKIEERTRKHEEAVKQAEADANRGIQPLVDKHKELTVYTEKLRDVLIGYNITPTDIVIDKSISRNEYEVLLDASVDICKKLTKSNGIKVMELFDRLEESDKFWKMLLTVVCLWVASPIIFVCLYTYMYFNTARIYKRIDKLRIAQSIMYDTDLERFLRQNEGEVSEIPELSIEDIEEERDEALVELLEKDPRKELESEGRAFASNITTVNAAFEEYTENARELHEQVVSDAKAYLTKLQRLLENTKKNIKMFGTYMNETPVMNTEYVLGRDREVVDEKYALGLRNIIFKETGDDMIEFIKLMLCNALLNVQAKSLYVRIYDPNKLGAAFSEFFQTDLQEYIDVITSDFDKQIEELRAYAQQNVKAMGKKTINEYNAECFEVGKVTLDYKILIILSGVKKIEEMETLKAFMKYSAQYGVSIWLSGSVALEGPYRFDEPYEGVSHPLKLTPELLKNVVDIYTKAVVEGKGAALPYVTKFVRKIIPEGKDWRFSTNKGIGLNFGFESGDPTKGYEIFLGDRAVHALMVGTTGAGKSATINQVLMSLLRKYSPKELELVMVDFKNVEFAAFTDPETGISKIPHAKIIAGTKDGEYAISIFDYLCAEMARRTEIFAGAGKTNLADYNNLMRETGREGSCLPRILLLIDEFQVMFTEVDQKSVDIITRSITALSKLARFCGCHMWFTSQSMKGTLSKDIMEQFVLRVALYCSKDTSETIIGSKAAGEMKSKVGWLYTNTAMGEDKTATKLWRVPFLDKDKDLPGQLEFLEQLRVEHNITSHNALFYNEDKLYGQEELFEVYRNNGMFENYPRLMVLGERTGFSLNKAPINFNLMLDDFENILVNAFEQVDALNLIMTVIDNVTVKDNAKLIVHSADKDTHALLEVEKYVPENILHMSMPNFEFGMWVDALEGMVASRSERSREELTPVYFLAIQWDKYRGFGVDENYKLVDRMKSLLRQGPSLGIHFVFILRQLKDFQTGMLNSFNHKICAKCGESDSYKMLESSRAAKLPSTQGFAIYAYGSATSKFKVYQHTFSRELEKRELVL